MQMRNAYIITSSNYRDKMQKDEKDNILREASDKAIVTKKMEECAKRNIYAQNGVLSATVKEGVNNNISVYVNINGVPFLYLSIKSEEIGVLNEDYFNATKELADGVATEALMLMLATLSMDKGEYRKKKTIKRTFGETYIFKEIPEIKVNHYLIDDVNGNWVVTHSDNKVRILSTTTFGEDTFPSELYPMPNGGKIEVFTDKNTCDINDNGVLAEILTNAKVEFKLGKCYHNTDTVIQALSAAKYHKQHRVEFYCGWVTQANLSEWIHHAWVVIDGNSVIDLTATRGGPIVEMRKELMSGEGRIYNREEIAKLIKKYEAEPLTFQERHFYGKVDGSWCYIGVPSNSEEGRESIKKLLAKHPDHPSYNNIDKKTGTNALNRAYYRIAP